ncbi:dihydropteroate synthase [Candidatus Kaiserbacteria bacterium RIFCSPHIGHO2_02_FULL_55_25]|uniref:Dihydropteroate synthase n=1 Tax=Candidatus Kaiserbacteria bacterium RIFCSPHIGHO2_02_FULL_55_25 TaxID=1798498 RepID=A0A1F6E4H2_9BACT|nr:MAG: dihydropteroate synthase [Candidatus Kaiserbacteria bacterium RIFCSPHIGHO2_02_FULL_55_25]OGG78645.1 MAG: dihydropteroate synthase [Candidatus Kaiserbacteria bacterium RIFCSPHIGHO2_12_FULL_55_13]OGG83605.1 MAG: dihydropteroate synthase [Candidatus Kaiserbacteria bacterium RIFCSPLOWO2_01_FULL_55_25]
MIFEWGKKTYVMGIINVTPDSFSGDGVLDVEAAVKQGIQMEKDGADVLDVGGESTRPGSVPVSLEDELARVIPVVTRLAKEVKVPISIDTYKAEVARQAIAAGASIINDVWGGRMEPEILTVAANTKVPIILMHNRSQAAAVEGERYVGVEYKDLIGDIKKELREQISVALAAGIAKENIIVDPGIGFGKTVEQNLELVNRLDELKELECPILVGPSRKSFVGYTLDLPASERLEGTLAAVALCIQKGADVVRVHDVKETDRTRKFVDAVVRR